MLGLKRIEMKQLFFAHWETRKPWKQSGKDETFPGLRNIKAHPWILVYMTDFGAERIFFQEAF